MSDTDLIKQIEALTTNRKSDDELKRAAEALSPHPYVPAPPVPDPPPQQHTAAVVQQGQQIVVVKGEPGPPGDKSDKGDRGEAAPKPAKVTKTLLHEEASNGQLFTIGVIVEKFDAEGRIQERVLDRLLKSDDGKILGATGEQLDPRLCSNTRPIAKAKTTVHPSEAGPIQRTTTWDAAGKVIGFVDELLYKAWEDTGRPGWSEKEEL